MARMLTEQDILKADTYIPIAKKSVFARGIANLCVVDMAISVRNGETVEPYPNMAREEPKMKMMYGLWSLLYFYLHLIDAEELTEEEYDEWGKLSVFNQLDRFKTSKDPEVRNRAYDIIDDYREFYRMIGCEINAMLNARNDLLPRFNAYIMSRSSPEEIKSMLEDLKETKSQIEEYVDKKAAHSKEEKKE